VLAQAARIFLSAVPDTRLVLIGFPSDLSEKDVRAEAGSVGDRLQFIPFLSQPELARFLAKAAVYTMPSLYESCGNTWIEAAACGLPVVGSTLSCGPEVVLDGQTGLLADPNNPQDVADKIVCLLRNEDLAKRLGQAGRERAKSLFSIEVAVRESQAFYELCIRDLQSRN
jgi:glycosyltransferase involved in cell wall biosynthesis